MLVVAATGSHSTGKSTLIQKIAMTAEENEYSVDVVMDLAREFNKEELGSVDTQREIFRKMIIEVNKRLDSGVDLLLLDRGFIDVLAYCLHNGWMYRWREEDWIDARDLVTEVVYAEREIIDLRIFCPIDNFDLVDDGFRFTDKVGRGMVDFAILSWLEVGGLDYVVYKKNLYDVWKAIEDELVVE